MMLRPEWDLKAGHVPITAHKRMIVCCLGPHTTNTGTTQLLVPHRGVTKHMHIGIRSCVVLEIAQLSGSIEQLDASTACAAAWSI